MASPPGAQLDTLPLPFGSSATAVEELDELEDVDASPSRTTDARASFDDDEGVRALAAHSAEAQAFLTTCPHDERAHVERFATAAALARDVLGRHPDLPGTARRALVDQLWPLLPPSARRRPFAPLPPAVEIRAPHFALAPGDVPRIARTYTAFLDRPDVVMRALRPGAGPFLVGRHVCPAAARGPCTAIVVDEVSTDVSGAVGVRGRIRAGAGGVGHDTTVRTTVEAIAAWMLSAGPDARGLDLRSADDRALLATWGHALREVLVRGRPAFFWLEDESTPPRIRVDVVSAALRAAIDVVNHHALDPRACTIAVPDDATAAALDAVGCFSTVEERPAGKGSARHVVWADAFLEPGFVAGRLSHVTAGRAFARLVTSMLAPLGVLTLGGLKDGQGAVVLQRLVPDDNDGAVHLAPPRLVGFADGATDELLWDAWAHGRGVLLPDLRGSAQHEPQAMAAWHASFLASLAGEAA